MANVSKAGEFKDVTRDLPEEQTDVTMSGSPPSERLNPSFRKEDEHMSEELKPLVMAPPSYASPDPNTVRAGLVTVEESPLDLSLDYGQGLTEAVHDGESNIVALDQAQSSRTPEGLRGDADSEEADKDMLASEWIEEVEEAENADALAAIGARYDAAGAEYSTVAAAMEKKKTALAEADNS